MALVFKQSKQLEAKIDDYLDMVVKGGLLFKQGVRYYMTEQMEDLERCMRELDTLESQGDAVRRDIETLLYLKTLIPESRGDVLGLLEAADRVLNTTAETLAQFSVELPMILEDVKESYLALTDTSISALEAMVSAVRAYFRDIARVRDHVAKVHFWEHEADEIADKLKRQVFRSDAKLSEKLHMRYFALHIERISDEAEDVSDRLAIATIKRHE
jgi:predicted phosphate transport protein (TIGR00153 family)